MQITEIQTIFPEAVFEPEALEYDLGRRLYDFRARGIRLKTPLPQPRGSGWIIAHVFIVPNAWQR